MAKAKPSSSCNERERGLLDIAAVQDEGSKKKFGIYIFDSLKFRIGVEIARDSGRHSYRPLPFVALFLLLVD